MPHGKTLKIKSYVRAQQSSASCQVLCGDGNACIVATAPLFRQPTQPFGKIWLDPRLIMQGSRPIPKKSRTSCVPDVSLTGWAFQQHVKNTAKWLPNLLHQHVGPCQLSDLQIGMHLGSSFSTTSSRVLFVCQSWQMLQQCLGSS